jgi:heme/copper-type cytochrome/quinol oxidase subunit 2
MWGQILTEASTQQNFNFGFSTYKSEILIHLSQWQYWWWFWFSAFWALYYFIILRTMTKRTFNFNITMNTSVRGRGKWGDFLVALIPVSWCCNILINSNFILRMIEWQNESSLFTIRVQGKQWYWVYKYDPNTAQAVLSTPKNVGHNRWRVVSGGESYNADTYYQAIHLAAHLEFQDSYSKFTEKIDTNKKQLNSMSLVNEKIITKTSWNNTILEDNITSNVTDNLSQNLENISDSLSTYNYSNILKINEPDLVNFMELGDDNLLNWNKLVSSKKNINSKLVSTNSNLTCYELYYNTSPDFIKFLSNLYSNTNANNTQFNSYSDFLQLDETSDADSNSRYHLNSQPFRLVRGIINQHVLDILQSSKFISTELSKPLFFNSKFIQSGEGLKDKELLPETLWGFRQKKYKKLKKFKFKPEVIYDPVTFKVIGQKSIPTSPKIDIAGINVQNIHSISNTLDNGDYTLTKKEKSLDGNFNFRISSRIGRHRSELVPVTLARRLLRTKRTLVLPAHVNITVITNSYDVVHSWFIPGLGLKMDCVPGRSTHHTFYIDNIGFYYGQCAEICGRYHHHMPIRLCALPFQHFVVWWQSKGLARLNRTCEISKNRFLQKNFNNPITREKLIFKGN